MNEQPTLFDVPPGEPPAMPKLPDDTCRHCAHRFTFQFYHSMRTTQHCGLQPTRRNTAGYKHIKVTDRACMNFKPDKPSKQNGDKD